MIDQTTDYDSRAAYLPRLIEWAEGAVDRFTRAAGEQVQQGFSSNAEAYHVLAHEYREIAERARQLQDDAPPDPLVDLTAWLRNKLERHFPHMRPELWQALAAVLRPFRRQS